MILSPMAPLGITDNQLRWGVRHGSETPSSSLRRRGARVPRLCPGNAEAALRRRSAVGEKLLADFPGAVHNPARELGLGHYDLGVLLYENGRLQEGVDAIRRGLELMETYEDTNLATLLVSCPAKQFRDPERALKLLKKQLQHEPLSADAWSILGLAQYQTGRFQEALASVQKSMELSSGGNAFHWFGMAMLSWQRDEKPKAKEWYDKAVEWTNKNAPNDQDLRRFRAEVEQLMGITAQSAAGALRQ